MNAKVTDEAKDLISNLITDRISRYQSLDQFKSHPWFTGIVWEQIRYQEPPYQPKFSGPDDTSNFDISDLKPINNPITAISSNKDANIELAFVGFTATFTTYNTTDEDKSIEQSKSIEPKVSPDTQYDNQVDDTDDIKDNREVSLLEERLKAAQQEWSEMSHLLSEMKKEKNTLSNKLRIKEEELDEQIEKNSNLRTQLRNYEKIKRQQLEELGNLQSELDAQKIVRKQGMLIFC